MSNKKKLIILFCASIIMMFSFGPRSSLGIFMQPVSNEFGWPVSIFALSLAIQNLVWGLFQPLMGGLADRFGATRVLVIGAILYSLGIYSLTFSFHPIQMVFSFGIIAGVGLSAASLTIVITAISRLLPKDQRSFAVGVNTAAGSLGQLVVTPVAQQLIAGYSWKTAIVMLSVIIITISIFAIGFASNRDRGRDRDRDREDSTNNDRKLSVIFHSFSNKNYLYLLTGFFVCGFHVAFITSHLPTYLAGLNISSKTGAIAIGLIGLFNVFGAFFAGVLGGKYPKAILLSALYLFRAICIFLFFVSPKSETSVYIFACTIGVLWLSTVPLTSGLVSDIFGSKNIGSLFGFVFLSHQLGAFFGVLIAGLIYDYFGGYYFVWEVSILLGLLAAIIHLPIKVERQITNPIIKKTSL